MYFLCRPDFSQLRYIASICRKPLPKEHFDSTVSIISPIERYSRRASRRYILEFKKSNHYRILLYELGYKLP